MIYNSCMCQKKLMIHQLDKKKNIQKLVILRS